MSERRATRVKVCGLTNLEDARWAHRCGADWLGFVVQGDSPRRIEPQAAAEILAAIPGAVGVFVMVAPDRERAEAVCSEFRPARLQIHRADPARWQGDFAVPLHFALGVRPDGSLSAEPPPPPSLVHLDTALPGREGGTGRTFPWPIAAAIAASRPIVLAGGLDADNVAEALAIVRPFAVDASSRLETAPGRKDPERVRRFVDAVRAFDDRQT